jgi:hypothetical protein
MQHGTPLYLSRISPVPLLNHQRCVNLPPFCSGIIILVQFILRHRERAGFLRSKYIYLELFQVLTNTSCFTDFLKRIYNLRSDLSYLCNFDYTRQTVYCVSNISEGEPSEGSHVNFYIIVNFNVQWECSLIGDLVELTRLVFCNVSHSCFDVTQHHFWTRGSQTLHLTTP